MSDFQAEDLIAVDEMGCVTGMSRRYGYAFCGKRAVSSEPAEKGTRLSVIGALSVDGFLGGLEVTGDVFEAFIEQVVIPVLHPGKVVLLDNASFHHRESIQELIEAQGASDGSKVNHSIRVVKSAHHANNRHYRK